MLLSGDVLEGEPSLTHRELIDGGELVVEFATGASEVVLANEPAAFAWIVEQPPHELIDPIEPAGGVGLLEGQ